MQRVTEFYSDRFKYLTERCKTFLRNWQLVSIFMMYVNFLGQEVFTAVWLGLFLCHISR